MGVQDFRRLSFKNKLMFAVYAVQLLIQNDNETVNDAHWYVLMMSWLYIIGVDIAIIARLDDQVRYVA